MASLRQTNFSGGELAPHLHGRTDLPVWGRSVRSAKNFFLSRQGMAVSRPGTVLVANSKLYGKPIRLIPFFYSATFSYVVELGEGYARFHLNGAPVLTGGVPVEVATPYEAGQLFDIQYAQVGDVMTLVHPDHEPAELRRTSGTSFTWTAISWTPLATYWLMVGPTGYATSTWEPAIISEVGALPFTSPDEAHPLVYWDWVATATLKDATTGRMQETEPVPLGMSYSGAPSNDGSLAFGPYGPVVLGKDRPITFRRASFAGAGAFNYNPGIEVVRYNFYRGRGGMMGYIGSSTGLDFIDSGDEPNYQIPPPYGTNPFATSSHTRTITGRYERPISVAYFEERRVFGGSSLRPNTLFISEFGNYTGFDVPPLNVRGQAIYADMAAVRREAIRTMVPAMRRLLVLTDSSLWSCHRGDAGTFDYDTVALRLEEPEGAAAMQPLVVEGTVLYVGALRRSVRALGASDADTLSSSSVSEHAQHLFEGDGPSAWYASASRKLKDWCYAKSPWGVVWAVREDGVLLSLTFSRSQEMAAWAHHETAGTVGSVCSVPEDSEDAVYVAVMRGTQDTSEAGYWRIERMSSRVTRNLSDDVSAVDCATRLELPVGAPVGTLTGLGRFDGQNVWLTSHKNTPVGPLKVRAGAVTITQRLVANDVTALGVPCAIAYIGLGFVAQLELLDVIGPEARLKQKAVTAVGFEVSDATGVCVGQDEEHLDEWRQRNVGTGYAAPVPDTQVVRMPVAGTWDTFARAVLQQPKPLPVTVTGLVREVDLGR